MNKTMTGGMKKALAEIWLEIRNKINVELDEMSDSELTEQFRNFLQNGDPHKTALKKLCSRIVNDAVKKADREKMLDVLTSAHLAKRCDG